jgi:exonuclease SbcD
VSQPLMSEVPPSLPSMRILHTSDWHLGRSLHGVDLLEHQAAYLDHLVDLAVEHRVDAVLVSGDVYDRAVPPVPAVELLADALRRLAEVTRVVLTAGNHDSATRLGFGADLYRERVRVHCLAAGVGRPVVLPDGHGRPRGLVYPLPYLDPDTARAHLAEEGADAPARSHDAVVSAAMRRVHGDLALRRAAAAAERLPAVVMAHAFIVGGEACESERDIRVGGVDSVPSGVFVSAAADSSVDYVALGHLHGPQQVTAPPRRGRENDVTLRYAGSPLAYSFSERSHRKSTALVELSGAGAVSVELIPAPVPRRLVDVAGTLEELCGRAFDAHTDAWARVTVTDPVRPADLRSAVARRFPHALVVQHRPSGFDAASAAPVVRAGMDPFEIAERFIHEVGGRRATPEEVAILRRAYEDALAADRSA